MEKPSTEPEQAKLKDLSNTETIYNILEQGTQQDLDELAKSHNISPEKMDLLMKNAKLRKKLTAQCAVELKKRKNQNPQPTAEELSMGCYIEVIEPQVRQAVLNLRRKGYNSYESGFKLLAEAQNINFHEDYFKNFSFPAELINELKGQGIELHVEPHEIYFKANSFLDENELKQTWDKIANAVKNSAKKVNSTKTGNAQAFRKKFNN